MTMKSVNYFLSVIKNAKNADVFPPRSGFVQQLHSVDPFYGADFSSKLKTFASALLYGKSTAGN